MIGRVFSNWILKKLNFVRETDECLSTRAPEHYNVKMMSGEGSPTLPLSHSKGVARCHSVTAMNSGEGKGAARCHSVTAMNSGEGKGVALWHSKGVALWHSGTRRAAWAVCLALFGVLLGVSGAQAELSTNLQIRTELNPYNKKVSVATYIDAEGNPTVPDDKGYAAIHYIYGTDSLVVETNFTDAEGRVCNCVDGYSKVKYAYSVRTLARTEYFDAKGNPANAPESYTKNETK